MIFVAACLAVFGLAGLVAWRGGFIIEVIR